jgi:transcriptional regulator with XRE-family HTH domain
MNEQPATPPPNVPEWDTADRMRKALRHADIGVQEMADYLGVARNTVSTWINGRIEPSTQTLRLWSLRCGVSYEWLTGHDDDTRNRENPQATGTTDPRITWAGTSRRLLTVAAA